MTVKNATTGINPLNRWGGIITRDAYRGVNIGLNLGHFMNATNFDSKEIISPSLGRCAYVVGGLAAASCGLVGGMVGVARAVGNALGNALNGNNKLDKNPLYLLEDTSHKKLQETLKGLIEKKWNNLLDSKSENIPSEQESYDNNQCLSVQELKEIFKTVFNTKKFKDIEKEVPEVMNVSFALTEGKPEKNATYHIADYINEAGYINKTPDTAHKTLNEFAKDVITQAKGKVEENADATMAQLEEDAKKAENEKKANAAKEKAKATAKLLAQAREQKKAKAEAEEEARKNRTRAEKITDVVTNFASNTIIGAFKMAETGAAIGTTVGIGTASAGVGVGALSVATSGAIVGGILKGVVETPIKLVNAVRDALRTQS